jgi:hypothetical protein
MGLLFKNFRLCIFFLSFSFLSPAQTPATSGSSADETEKKKVLIDGNQLLKTLDAYECSANIGNVVLFPNIKIYTDIDDLVKKANDQYTKTQAAQSQAQTTLNSDTAQVSITTQASQNTVDTSQIQTAVEKSQTQKDKAASHYQSCIDKGNETLSTLTTLKEKMDQYAREFIQCSKTFNKPNCFENLAEFETQFQNENYGITPDQAIGANFLETQKQNISQRATNCQNSMPLIKKVTIDDKAVVENTKVTSECQSAVTDLTRATVVDLQSPKPTEPKSDKVETGITTKLLTIGAVGLLGAGAAEVYDNYRDKKRDKKKSKETPENDQLPESIPQNPQPDPPPVPNEPTQQDALPNPNVPRPIVGLQDTCPDGKLMDFSGICRVPQARQPDQASDTQTPTDDIAESPIPIILREPPNPAKSGQDRGGVGRSLASNPSVPLAFYQDKNIYRIQLPGGKGSALMIPSECAKKFSLEFCKKQINKTNRGLAKKIKAKQNNLLK